MMMSVFLSQLPLVGSMFSLVGKRTPAHGLYGYASDR
jgi:hypothetical protein